MSQSSKRERSRAARAARQEALRRQRIVRIVAVGVVLALVVGFALLSAGGANGPDEASDRRLEPGTTEATEATDATEQDLGVACDGEDPPEANAQQYQSPP